MPASTRQQVDEEERAATAVALVEAQGQAEQAAAAERAARAQEEGARKVVLECPLRKVTNLALV